MSSFIIQGGRSIDFNGKSKIYEMFENKRVLYVPFANKNFEKGLENFKKYVPESTEIIVATIKNFTSMIELCEVVYIAGGIYEDLYTIILENHFDNVLKKYLKSDKIFAGISAGAILISKYGVCDKNIFVDDGVCYNFKVCPGLGFLDIIVFPHYERCGAEVFSDKLKEYDLNSFLLEDDVALYFNNGEMIVLKDDKRKSIYKLDRDNSYLLVPLYERNV